MLKAEDQFEIRDLLGRYCAATDSGRPDKMAELFTQDALWTSPFGHCEGRQALLDFMTPTAQAASALRHLTLNTVLEADGDEVRGYSYVVVLNMAGEKPEIFFSGFYEDIYVRDEGNWRFRYRKINPETNAALSLGG